jgi:hypothetical protein
MSGLLERLSVTGAIAALAFATYFSAARAVYDIYPFSVFAMYGGIHATSASRLVAQVDGELIAVEDLVDWDCGELPAVADTHCPELPDAFSIFYKDEEALEWLAEHAGPGGIEVELRRAVWRVPRDRGPDLTPQTCLVRACRARLR